MPSPSARDNPWILAVPEADSLEIPSLRLYLVSCSDGEVSRHLTETFRYHHTLTGAGYSVEALRPIRQALLEILVELRVRGLEVDYAGNVYHPVIFHAVPPVYTAARKRQVQRLKGLHVDLLGHLCSKTLLQTGQAATRTGKRV